MKKKNTNQVDLFNPPYDPLSRICPSCKVEYLTTFKKRKKSRFCSKACAIISRRKKNSDKVYKPLKENVISNYTGLNNPNYKGGGTECICINCSIDFRVPVNMLKGGKHSGKFCSKNCDIDYKTRNRVPMDRIRVDKRFTRAILGCIKRNNLHSKTKWLKYVDWNLVQLKTHIEKQFIDGMTWENHGEWHLDHKKPKSYFPYMTENDDAFKQCWALTNLQPLWKEDNLIKGGKNTKINREQYGDIYIHYTRKQS